jgi:hypothetical protein
MDRMDTSIEKSAYELQIMEYRMMRQKEYERRMRLKEIQQKYSNLLIMDKKLLSIVRIQRFLRRHFFKEPINMSLDEIETIPGLFRYRLMISELNTVDFLDDTDDNMIVGLLGAINITEQQYYQIMIDLRIYGNEPEMPIFINEKPYYLSYQQKEKIRNIWSKINPDTRNGLIYQQNLAYQKSEAKDM